MIFNFPHVALEMELINVFCFKVRLMKNKIKKKRLQSHFVLNYIFL